MLSTQAGKYYILDVALQFSFRPLSEFFLSFCLVIDVVIIQFTLFYSCDFHAPNSQWPGDIGAMQPLCTYLKMQVASVLSLQF